ncbi:hypothetical protein LAUMK191_02177 [Mycobacterium attenuatum]|uniref:Uncharacterized protein n=1 Tax=Mycobacterium attenuatum TaxID=2341086 RepID=A0A498PVU0_9MYCO|nr:hypothetical protein LAUMK136_02177 [Mycobacterium attenuatum]VBA51292.1 hypothetical protein LAUMK191_02177 [Mycobacterium attenuatum]VBA57009.1 hypothetical protein LAUMK41_02252 [Mycobacterium attenuatum]
MVAGITATVTTHTVSLVTSGGVGNGGDMSYQDLFREDEDPRSSRWFTVGEISD